MSIEKFNEDYYERGTETGVSCYDNYRWLPYKTIPTVMSYIDYIQIPRGALTLDFGCAKGFYVKALRLLGRDAYGCDISKYAIGAADEETTQFLKLSSEDNPIPFINDFDYIIAKDVLEHISEDKINFVLREFRSFNPKSVFVIVPLTDIEKGKYLVPEDELDTTHVIRKNKDGWTNIFYAAGFRVASFSYRVRGIKDHQAKYCKGVGFFILKKA